MKTDKEINALSNQKQEFIDAVWKWGGKFWNKKLRGNIGLLEWNKGIKALLKELEEK